MWKRVAIAMKKMIVITTVTRKKMRGTMRAFLGRTRTRSHPQSLLDPLPEFEPHNKLLSTRETL